MWEWEEVRVHQQPHPVSIEAGEHLAHGWNGDLPLVKAAPLLGEEDAVRHGSVRVSVCVVVQADHVALGDVVEDGGGEEGEEADDSAKHSLHGEALDTQSRLQQDVWHDEETGAAGAVGEKLHPWKTPTGRRHKLAHARLLGDMLSFMAYKSLKLAFRGH